MDNNHPLPRSITALSCVFLLCAQASATDLSPNSPRARAAAEAAAAERAQSRGAAMSPTSTPTRQIVIKYRESAEAVTPQTAPQRAQRLGERTGVELQNVRIPSENSQVVTVGESTNEQELKSIADRIERENPDVEYAEPERIMRIQQVNDPRYNEQWHYHLANTGIALPEAWQRATGRDIVVAVIDTGIRMHADLEGRILPGYDFIASVVRSNDGTGRDSDPTDPGDWCLQDANPLSSWHGTHVAGTIAAATDNNVGGAGVARGAKILPIRVLGQCGGSSIDIADGIRWAAGLSVLGVPDNANPARVINLSLGGLGACGPRYSDVIRQVRQLGVTVVAAAGNSDMNAGDFAPANCEGVISVAATNRQGSRAYFGRVGSGSNWGSIVKIAAPGGETFATLEQGVLSTLNSGITTPGNDSYEFYQGTSMAAPHVAGATALLYEIKPSITPDEVLSILQHTSQAFPQVVTRQCDRETCGTGIMNGAAAVNYLIEESATSGIAPNAAR